MVRNLLYLFLLLTIVSCERIFINGDLDGMWRLRSVESVEGVEYPDSIFYSFQRHLVRMGIYSETEHPTNFYMACFQYSNDSIVMDNFYRYPGTAGVCVPDELKNLYIYDTVVGFRVEYLNDKLLVLSSSGLKYTFDKW